MVYFRTWFRWISHTWGWNYSHIVREHCSSSTPLCSTPTQPQCTITSVVVLMLISRHLLQLGHVASRRPISERSILGRDKRLPTCHCANWSQVICSRGEKKIPTQSLFTVNGSVIRTKYIFQCRRALSAMSKFRSLDIAIDNRVFFFFVNSAPQAWHNFKGWWVAGRQVYWWLSYTCPNLYRAVLSTCYGATFNEHIVSTQQWHTWYNTPVLMCFKRTLILPWKYRCSLFYIFPPTFQKLHVAHIFFRHVTLTLFLAICKRSTWYHSLPPWGLY